MTLPPPGCAAHKEYPVKKKLGILALIGGIVGALSFWRRRKSDDEFLDEELQ